MQIAHFAQRSTSAIYLEKTKHHSTCCSLENLNESRAVESIVSLQLGFNIDGVFGIDVDLGKLDTVGER